MNYTLEDLKPHLYKIYIYIYMEQQILQTLVDTTPIIKDGVNVSHIKNIILIDKTIETPEIFFLSNNNETLPIYYNYYTDKYKLFEYLDKEFINIDRIAFIFNNSMMNNKYFLNNELFFTENDIIQFKNNKECLENYSSNVIFIIKICKKFNIKNVDFLACNSLEYNNWKIYYELLQYYLTTIIGASNDLTGNIINGGNWIMENTNEDIQNIYFNKNITNYSSTLISSSISYYRYQYYGSNYFSVNVKNIKIDSIITLNTFTNFNFFLGTATPQNPTKNYVLYYRNINNNDFNSVNDINNMNITIYPNEQYEFLVAFQTTFYIVSGAQVSPNTLLITDNFLSLYSGKSGYNNDQNAYNTLSPSNIYGSLGNSYQLSYTLNYTYKLKPTIGTLTIPTKTYGDAPFTITQPTSNSLGSFSYTSSNTSVATISGNTITIVGVGNSTITATQAATSDYLLGTITTTFQVNQSTPTNPVIINNSNELLYFMNTSSSYASITDNLEINYDLITSSYKVLTGNNIKITKSNN